MIFTASIINDKIMDKIFGVVTLGWPLPVSFWNSSRLTEWMLLLHWRPFNGNFNGNFVQGDYIHQSQTWLTIYQELLSTCTCRFSSGKTILRNHPVVLQTCPVVPWISCLRINGIHATSPDPSRSRADWKKNLTSNAQIDQVRGAPLPLQCSFLPSEDDDPSDSEMSMC